MARWGNLLEGVSQAIPVGFGLGMEMRKQKRADEAHGLQMETGQFELDKAKEALQYEQDVLRPWEAKKRGRSEEVWSQQDWDHSLKKRLEGERQATNKALTDDLFKKFGLSNQTKRLANIISRDWEPGSEEAKLKKAYMAKYSGMGGQELLKEFQSILADANSGLVAPEALNKRVQTHLANRQKLFDESAKDLKEHSAFLSGSPISKIPAQQLQQGLSQGQIPQAMFDDWISRAAMLEEDIRNLSASSANYNQRVDAQVTPEGAKVTVYDYSTGQPVAVTSAMFSYDDMQKGNLENWVEDYTVTNVSETVGAGRRSALQVAAGEKMLGAKKTMSEIYKNYQTGKDKAGGRSKEAEAGLQSFFKTMEAGAGAIPDAMRQTLSNAMSVDPSFLSKATALRAEGVDMPTAIDLQLKALEHGGKIRLMPNGEHEIIINGVPSNYRMLSLTSPTVE